MPKGEGTEIIIGPAGGQVRFWRDLWRYRELFAFLTWRDILVRYKQTAIGVAWSLIRPLVTMAAFSLVFGKLAGLSSGDSPYPLLVYAALLPWQFFAVAIADSGNSLVNNAQLVTKVYFPRLIVPVNSVVVGLVDFLVSLGVYAVRTT
ncbi:MAG: type transporter [Deltaproteobacteria bacterium]|nr:type transporter [Deltaproteobacteria bacterium]